MKRSPYRQRSIVGAVLVTCCLGLLIMDGRAAEYFSLGEVVSFADEFRSRGECCGPISVLRVASRVDRTLTLASVRQMFPAAGTNRVRVVDVVDSLRKWYPGVRAIEFRNKRDLDNASLPIIALVNQGRHCVVVEGQGDQVLTVWDPVSLKASQVERSRFNMDWSGEAVVLSDLEAGSAAWWHSPWLVGFGAGWAALLLLYFRMGAVRDCN